jgi:predicted chitinase
MMKLLTPDQVHAAWPRVSEEIAKYYLWSLNPALVEFEINTPARIAAFFAQVGHESGQLAFWRELWGPTDQQKKYEPPSTVATDLGNTEPGDGFRYRGRGPIQITGRSNYKKYGELLHLPLIEQPELAAIPGVGFRIAGAFWKTHGLNELADSGTEDDFKRITRKINGGLTHLAQRIELWERAKKVFGVESPV